MPRTSLRPDDAQPEHYPDYHEISIDNHLRRGLDKKELLKPVVAVRCHGFPTVIDIAALALAGLSETAASRTGRYRLVMKHGMSILQADENVKELIELRRDTIRDQTQNVDRLMSISMPYEYRMVQTQLVSRISTQAIPVARIDYLMYEGLLEATGWTEDTVVIASVLKSLATSKELVSYNGLLAAEVRELDKWIQRSVGELHGGTNHNRTDEVPGRQTQPAQSERRFTEPE